MAFSIFFAKKMKVKQDANQFIFPLKWGGVEIKNEYMEL